MNDFKVWTYKYDLAEINSFNYKEVLKTYFKLTSKKISFLAMMLVINVILSVFSKFVMGMIPIDGFLVVELTFFTVLITYFITNLLYSFLFLELTVWMRMMFTGTTPIELVAMNLVDGAFLICFAILCFSSKLILIKMGVKNILNKMFYIQIILFILTTVIVAAWAIFLNKEFLLDAYGASSLKTRGFYITLMWFNMLKSTINWIIFLMLYKILIILNNRHKF